MKEAERAVHVDKNKVEETILVADRMIQVIQTQMVYFLIQVVEEGSRSRLSAIESKSKEKSIVDLYFAPDYIMIPSIPY